MIPQQWPRPGPLDKLNEIEHQQSPRHRQRKGKTQLRSTPRFSRLVVVMSIIVFTLIVMAAIISMVMIFGYH